MATEPSLLALMQLADSGLPTGSYAFSNGLEGAYHLGLLNSARALEEFLCCAVEAVVCAEIPFVQSCFALEDADWRAVGDITVYYDATQTAPSVLHASLVTGKNWLRLLEGLYQQAGLSALRQRLLAEKLPLHFTIVFALSLKRVGFSLEQAKRLLLFQSLRDQVSAAVRLGLVGPLEAARRLRSLNEYGEAALARSGARCYRQAYRCVPQLDIAQGMHGYLYSRLFQS
jgi:urease accessory protein